MTGFMNKEKAVNVIYLDLTKAFDIVFCNVLVYELGCYGLDNQMDKK